MNWFVAHRQAWIAEMLAIYGFINRGHLERKFGVSRPQASTDLQAFLKAHPDGVRYDTSRKAYVATPAGTAVFLSLLSPSLPPRDGSDGP
jgi:hypothetical protein